MKYLVVQQGGSTHERYVHGFDTLKEAQQYRKSAARGAYQTSPPILIPKLFQSPGRIPKLFQSPGISGLLLNLCEQVAQASGAFS